MKTILIFILLFLFIPFSFPGNIEKENNQVSLSANAGNDAVTRDKTEFTIVSFGSGGQIKMIYDRRHRPQSVFLNNKVYIVYNGGASMSAEDKERTYPFVTSFNPKTGVLSSPIQLGTKGSHDHHYCPIIWVDNNDFFHILSGNHSTAGTHLISKKRADIGESAADWTVAPQVRHSLSYPTVYNIYDNKKLMYFRTGEHRSAWTYLISSDEGKTWTGPKNNVVDLNAGGETTDENFKLGLPEWASYETCLPGKDGKFLHVAFCYYDDNKKNIPDKFYNPRYHTEKNLDLKYNLYYVKINLQTHEVKNFAGETVRTPVDLAEANYRCKIWDTDWRGSGIPPEIIIDENNNPAFLHMLSEDTPEQFNYYYVRYVKNEWKETVIAPSDHFWNSSYLKLDGKGVLHAYLIMSNGKYDRGKGINRYGGGNIEEWCSYDKGNTWKRIQNLIQGNPEYRGWKFNNIQPVEDPKGNIIDNMLLFYGWKDEATSETKGFLLYDKK
ncbi:MAG TPA: BNR-4 repeat-containing protein [Draconibacterium sp.]|nr:BNR-4 repeat-containing protein [Draconibacterium sp.]